MISIINDGSGNIAALITMMRLSNFEFEVIDSADQVRSAKRFLLPGVGAFGNTMQAFIDSVETVGRRQAAPSFSKGNIELCSSVALGLQA
jgi:imidazoleglycerol phosphate synthase glutamine amidotransferase subunit HisH